MVAKSSSINANLIQWFDHILAMVLREHTHRLRIVLVSIKTEKCMGHFISISYDDGLVMS